MGSFRLHNGTNEEATPSTSSLNNHVNFSSGQRVLPQITEIGDDSIGESNPDGNVSKRPFIPSFTNDSWDDTLLDGLKRARVSDGSMFSGISTLDSQVTFAD